MKTPDGLKLREENSVQSYHSEDLHICPTRHEDAFAQRDSVAHKGKLHFIRAARKDCCIAHRVTGQAEALGAGFNVDGPLWVERAHPGLPLVPGRYSSA
eukprot:1148577-Pelagomonas_calceolata.AAC.5